MHSQQLRVIVDDTDGNITYGGGQWLTDNHVQWYGGSCQFPAFANNTIFGSFSLTFEGTSIAFIGNTPPPTSSQNITVSIDGGTPYNTSYNAPPGKQTYVQWYQSPLLPNGQHTISVDHIDGTAIDMALITVEPDTSLAEKTVFVDDNDPAIQYSGKWTKDDSEFKPGHLNLLNGFAIGNTTKRSTTAGDTMTFRFSGTSVTIYGIFSWANVGKIIATYTLDGDDHRRPYNVFKNTTEHKNGDGDSANFSHFHAKNLPPGDHTLVVNITEIEKQTFIFDYIVYSPSSSPLATMPDLAPGITRTGSPAIKTSASTPSVSAKTTQTRAAGPSSGQGGATQPSNAAIPINIGALVGGNIGIVVLFVAVVITFVLYKRMKRAMLQHRAQVQVMPVSLRMLPQTFAYSRG